LLALLGAHPIFHVSRIRVNKTDINIWFETWTITKKEEQALLIFERKIFRRIYGRKYEDVEWKIGTNRELEELNTGENIVKWIKRQWICWLGHQKRMEKDRMPKKIFTQELEGTRRRGRPRKGRREEVEVLFDRPKPTAGCSANGSRSHLSIAIKSLEILQNKRGY
jgi:hypothetical protein